jgi:hypothetical protein
MEVQLLKKKLLDMLRCPNCVQEKEGLLEYYRESWLICQDCDRKYPIDVDDEGNDIPVMLIDEGDKWIDTKKDDLPVPPPTIVK